MNSEDSLTLLLADIGGTHIRLALAKPGVPSLNQLTRYRCADFESLNHVLHEFLRSAIPGQCVHACFAVAAPVTANEITEEIVMTNSDWRFSVSAIRETFGWQSLEIVNDFEAVAHGIAHLDSDNLVQLGGGSRNTEGNIAVLGPGTGLGVKHLVRTEQGWKVLAGEGGHVDFAPVDEADLALWHFIRESRDRVSIEEILSGRGLVHIYQSMARLRSADATIEHAREIVNRGLAGECSICEESLQQFCSILGTFAGNLALNLNTSGGVFLCGGVLTQLGDFLQSSQFRERFEAKGRFRSYVDQIPVFLITDQEPGLNGALAYVNAGLDSSEA